jgi:hypothetical protein
MFRWKLEMGPLTLSPCYPDTICSHLRAACLPVPHRCIVGLCTANAWTSIPQATLPQGAQWPFGSTPRRRPTWSLSWRQPTPLHSRAGWTALCGASYHAYMHSVMQCRRHVHTPHTVVDSHTQSHTAARSHTQSHTVTHSHKQSHRAASSHTEPQVVTHSHTQPHTASRSNAQPHTALHSRRHPHFTLIGAASANSTSPTPLRAAHTATWPG